MSRQPKHHYLPAVFIARFAASPDPVKRESLVWARNRGIGAPFTEKAENLGFARGIYSTTDADDFGEAESESSDIDGVWKTTEDRLSPALDLLVESDGPLDARAFGQVLVPFVAGLFVRGWEFDKRFTKRMERVFVGDAEMLSHSTSRTNINAARLIELQRLFSPVMRARWAVLKNDSDVPLITNDQGAYPWNDAKHRGIVVPLDPKHALQLEPRPKCPRMAFGTDHWWIDVAVGKMSRTEVLRTNRLCARVAPRQIYGPTEASVVAQQVEMTQRQPVDVPEGAWGLSGKYLAWCDAELFEFLVEVTQPPDQLPRISREEAISRMGWPLPMFHHVVPDKGAIYDKEPAAEIRLEEMAEQKKAKNELEARFGPLERVRAPQPEEEARFQRGVRAVLRSGRMMLRRLRRADLT